MKQTAVEWFYSQLIEYPLGDWEYFLKQAKEMEKQQITMAFYDGNYLNLNSAEYYNFRYTTNEVTASKTITGVITKGKKYEVLQETKNTFVIKDDTNDKLEFNKSYFENEKVL